MSKNHDFTKKQRILEEKRNAKFLENDEIIELLNLGDSRTKWAKKFTHEGIRKYLPYGMWVTIGGEQILFNRSYQPFLTRGVNSRVSGEDPERFVTNIKTAYRLFNDGCPPNSLYNGHLGMGITNVMQQTFLRCCMVIRLFCTGATVEEIEKYCFTRVDFNGDGTGQRVKLTPLVIAQKTNVVQKECHVCGKSYASGGAMTAHMRSAHPEEL